MGDRVITTDDQGVEADVDDLDREIGIDVARDLEDEGLDPGHLDVRGLDLVVDQGLGRDRGHDPRIRSPSRKRRTKIRTRKMKSKPRRTETRKKWRTGLKLRRRKIKKTKKM